MSTKMSMPMPYNNGIMMMNMDHMAMQMSFFWGKDVVLLFSGWPGNGRPGMYILALAMVFLLAVGVEILSAAPSLKSRGVGPMVGASVHAAVYAVRMILAYLVMLSVMSFNIGVFVVAVAGHTVGQFTVKYRALTAVARAVDPQF